MILFSFEADTLEAISSGKNDKLQDQILLDKFVFYNFWESAVVHDAYYCRADHLQGALQVAFPTHRETGARNFVGSASDVPDSIFMEWPCPMECRPAEHPEWQ